ncbi:MULTISPECIES: transglutaminase family protein [unclassified Bradyrhizobium]|uniref:transglutaminase family protein n=1 Tax=unclassified Bradyrhizobium TaxID=2631580 RepID=UPI0024B09081|nr:transglutaminase family protein [Bradyrhizobium sp. CB2312]WFU72480.1 transglutaminase family protein [Bradyrhizobium sp. CB2312]
MARSAEDHAIMLGGAMGIIFEIKHTTTYNYARPVTFGPHRAMFLPRRGAGGRLLSWSAGTNLRSRIRWISDSLSNNIAEIEIEEPGSELIFTFQFRGIHFGAKDVKQFVLERRAERMPVQYTPDEWNDLVGFMRPHTEDPDLALAEWARSFVVNGKTIGALEQMLDAFRDGFNYQAREAEGTLAPAQTLHARSGTCRDYAWLMIEALRRLGFAARFVSGYIYDAALDGGEIGMAGSGATHAWVQVFLPGAGWMNYDPTNHINAGFDLIPVALARHPAQAVPLAGAWLGSSEDYLGMSVRVEVHKLGDVADQSEG